MTNMKPPQEGRNTGAPSLRGLQGRSATGLNGQAAKDEVSAVVEGGWMPENISGVPAGRSVFHLTSPFIGLLGNLPSIGTINKFGSSIKDCVSSVCDRLYSVVWILEDRRAIFVLPSSHHCGAFHRYFHCFDHRGVCPEPGGPAACTAASAHCRAGRHALSRHHLSERRYHQHHRSCVECAWDGTGKR